MARWFVVQNAAGATVSSEVIAIHAALLSTGQIVYFSGDEHDPGLNAAHDIDHTRMFDCNTFSVGTLSSPTSDVFCCGHCLLDDGSVLVAGGTYSFRIGVASESSTDGSSKARLSDPSRHC